jgi:hypothetical protein
MPQSPRHRYQALGALSEAYRQERAKESTPRAMVFGNMACTIIG